MAVIHSIVGRVPAPPFAEIITVRGGQRTGGVTEEVHDYLVQASARIITEAVRYQRSFPPASWLWPRSSNNWHAAGVHTQTDWLMTAQISPASSCAEVFDSSTEKWRRGNVWEERSDWCIERSLRNSGLYYKILEVHHQIDSSKSKVQNKINSISSCTTSWNMTNLWEEFFEKILRSSLTMSFLCYRSLLFVLCSNV